jgi:hypothetical protein
MILLNLQTASISYAKSQVLSGAKSGAPSANPTEIDPTLIIRNWPNLTEPIRQAINAWKDLPEAARQAIVSTAQLALTVQENTRPRKDSR